MLKAKYYGALPGGSMLPQKIGCSRLAKNAFGIQHLLHYSIVYTFTHYYDGCTYNNYYISV